MKDGHMVCVDGEPGYFVTWVDYGYLFVQKDGIQQRVERYRCTP